MQLEKQIKKYVEGILDLDDVETRQYWDGEIKRLRADLAALQVEQDATPSSDDSLAVTQLATWWDQNKASLVNTSIPADGTIAKTICHAVASEAEKPADWDWWKTALLGYETGTVVRVDLHRRSVNEMLHSLVLPGQPSLADSSRKST